MEDWASLLELHQILVNHEPDGGDASRHHLVQDVEEGDRAQIRDDLLMPGCPLFILFTFNVIFSVTFCSV